MIYTQTSSPASKYTVVAFVMQIVVVFTKAFSCHTHITAWPGTIRRPKAIAGEMLISLPNTKSVKQGMSFWIGSRGNSPSS